MFASKLWSVEADDQQTTHLYRASLLRWYSQEALVDLFLVAICMMVTSGIRWLLSCHHYCLRYACLSRRYGCADSKGRRPYSVSRYFTPCYLWAT